jgi:hypothetical protein
MVCSFLLNADSIPVYKEIQIVWKRSTNGNILIDVHKVQRPIKYIHGEEHAETEKKKLHTNPVTTPTQLEVVQNIFNQLM